MRYRELLELIEEGENIQCEFKRKFSTSEKIAREMIAFANTKGGYLLFGVDDDKKIVGVESEKETSELSKRYGCKLIANLNLISLLSTKKLMEKKLLLLKFLNQKKNLTGYRIINQNLILQTQLLQFE
jgi:predicted HTH transcriptional regulator